MNERLIPVRQTWAAILALMLASILSCALVVVRAYYAGTTDYLFFFWNLFLAWVPVGAALVFYGLAARQSRGWSAAVHGGGSLVPVLPQCALHRDGYRASARKTAGAVLVRHRLRDGICADGSLPWLPLSLSHAGGPPRMDGPVGRLAVCAHDAGLERLRRLPRALPPLELVGCTRGSDGTLLGVARVANPWNDVQPLAFSTTFFAFSLVCYLIVYSFAHLHGWVQKASSRPV